MAISVPFTSQCVAADCGYASSSIRLYRINVDYQVGSTQCVTTCNCCQHIPESSPVWMIGLLSDLDPARAQQRPGEFTRCRVSLLELDQGTSDTSFMAWH